MVKLSRVHIFRIQGKILDFTFINLKIIESCTFTIYPMAKQRNTIGHKHTHIHNENKLFPYILWQVSVPVLTFLKNNVVFTTVS